MALQIEVGKSYRALDGTKVTIERRDSPGDDAWPFACTRGNNYAPDGLRYRQRGPDLVAEWSEPATPDADGWIAWAGGECPVPGDTVVMLRYRDGQPSSPAGVKVGVEKFDWRHFGMGNDIVAYRIVRPEQDEGTLRELDADTLALIRKSVDKNPSSPGALDAEGWTIYSPVNGCPVPPGELRNMQFKWANGDVTYGIVAPEWFSTVGAGLKGYRVLDMPTEQMRQKWPVAPEMPVTMHTPTISAPAILEAAAGHMRDRAATYDVPTGERSMARTVAVFNALHGLALTEAQGWSFMAVLKHVRAFQSGRFHGDSVEDMAAYVSLMGEAQARAEGGE